MNFFMSLYTEQNDQTRTGEVVEEEINDYLRHTRRGEESLERRVLSEVKRREEKREEKRREEK